MGYFMSKHFHGRRYYLLFILIAVAFVSDISMHILRAVLTPDFVRTQVESDSEMPFDQGTFMKNYFYVNTSLTYLLYFKICMLGIIDISKIQQLQENKSMPVLLISLVFFTQQLVQGIFYQNWIPILKRNYPVFACTDVGCDLLATYCMYPLLKIEMTEINHTGFKRKVQERKHAFKHRQRI
jgi:hypothetical protein